MQDFRNRFARTFSIAICIYLIQALSFSTVYAAVIGGSPFAKKEETAFSGNFSEIAFGFFAKTSKLLSLKIK